MRYRRFVGIAAILLVVGVVSAAVMLFNQTFPSVVTVTNVVSNCAQLSPTPQVITAGSDGDLTFSCDSGDPVGHPAFTTTDLIVIYPQVNGFVSPYTTLWVYDADGAFNTGNCSGRTGAQYAANGTRETFPANGWNYCARYHNAGLTDLPSFTVTWIANAP